MRSNGIDHQLGALTASQDHQDRAIDKLEAKIDGIDHKVDRLMTSVALLAEKVKPSKAAKPDSIFPAGTVNRTKLVGIVTVVVAAVQALIEAIK